VLGGYCVEVERDAVPGSDGEMSVTGWANTAIFQNYITKHFANHAGITNRNDQ
jgi:hypothetical protein